MAPPPKYFTDKQIIELFGSLPTDKKEILKPFSIPEHGGLIWTDEEALNKQKGVLSHVIK